MDVKAFESRIDAVGFKAELAQKAARIDQILQEVLDKQIGIPARLGEAMKYMVLSPGKRIRAVLVQWVCELLEGQVNRDADIAAETTEFTRTQILIQSGTAILAQANIAPQAVLQLLG